MGSDANETSARSPKAKTSSGLWQIASIAVIAALIVACGYYASALAREDTFADERAFRVLEDVVTQIKNLQKSRATLLTSMPEDFGELSRPLCRAWNGANEGGAPASRGATKFELYAAHLDLVDANICLGARRSDSREKMPLESRCSPELHNAEVKFVMDPARGRITSILCEEKRVITINEHFEKAAGRIVSQDLFSEALLSSSNGIVFAEFTKHGPPGSDSHIRLHEATGERLNILNAKRLFSEVSSLDQGTATHDGSNTTDADNSGKSHLLEPALHPAVYSQQIGNRSYRIYVLPFRSAYDLTQESEPSVSSSKSSARAPKLAASDAAECLYVVGIMPVDISDQILHALWPSGLWVVILLILLSLLSWPSLHLAFGPAEEAIGRGHAAACIGALILIPAVLGIASATVWGQIQLQNWMAGVAHRYAVGLENQLHADVIAAAEALGRFRSVYEPLVTSSSRVPTCDMRSPRSDLSAFPKCHADPDHQHPNSRACLVEPVDGVCDPVRLLSPDPDDYTKSWSPFRIVAALNVNGLRFGNILTPFENINVSSKLSLKDREYFQNLSHAQEWVIRGGKSDGLRFVAQRLYNRADASRALQVAVPLRCGTEAAHRQSDFCGLVTGDLRMHGFIRAVSPPLLKFAVVDNDTGTVIFHSDDSRSLSENFWQESENNPGLLAATRARHEGRFSGMYLGEPHEFFYEPMEEVPWGVVIFYSAKDLGELPLIAGSCALIACAGAVLLFLLGGVLVCLAWKLLRPNARAGLGLLKRVWPRPPLNRWYGAVARFRPSLLAGLTLWIMLSLGWPPFAAFAAMLLVLALTIVLGIVLVGRIASPTVDGSAALYAECWVATLIMVSVIPAIYVYGVFQESQRVGLIADGLVEAGNQMQRRYELVQRDLQRWTSSDGAHWVDRREIYPDEWTIAVSPDLGLLTSQPTMSPDVDLTVHELDDAGNSAAARTEATIPWVFHMIWEAAADTPSQRRRLALLAADSNNSAVHCELGPAGARESCRMTVPGRRELVLTQDTQPEMSDPGSLLKADPEQESTGFLILGLIVLSIWAALQGLAYLIAVRLFGLKASYAPCPVKSGPCPIDGTECPFNPATFKQVWNTLSTREQITLYQMALNQFPNPKNEAVIDDLLDDGPPERVLIKVAPWPMLRWPDKLPQLIRRSETLAEFERQQTDAARGVWKNIRGPLFILLMVLVAWLSWAAGGSMKALSAVLVATAAFLGQIGQLVNFIRSGGSSSAKPSA